MAGSLKYLSNFSQPFKVSWLIAKLNWTLWIKDCVSAATCVKKDGANSSHIVFSIKDRKLYSPLVTLSAKGNQKLSKLLSKGFERSLHCSENKKK